MADYTETDCMICAQLAGDRDDALGELRAAEAEIASLQRKLDALLRMEVWRANWMTRACNTLIEINESFSEINESFSEYLAWGEFEDDVTNLIHAEYDDGSEDCTSGEDDQ